MQPISRIVGASAVTLAFSTLLAAQGPGNSHCFDGTGGPNGDFDWYVLADEFFVLDTDAGVIVGGPNGTHTATENVIDGRVDVRNLVIEARGEVRVQGSHALHLVATGDVILRGRLDLSGFSGRDVATLNTGNLVERGGAGAAGGGRGGDANVNTTTSSPRGGWGNGPFAAPQLGGQGGESAYALPGLGKDARRPGGGGGGRFARDQGSSSDGLAATDGHDGSPAGVGAESGQSPARGGSAGIGPFVDPKPRNDYFGIAPLVGRHGQLIGLIPGELHAIAAGAGGGGGGNAIPASSFPNPSWTFASDEKGGAGGGAGGALHVQALGRIVFGLDGQILANGGRGATGENTNFLDHVGGTGGGGSGGHVLLESAHDIDFTDGGANSNAAPRDWITALGAPERTGPLGDVNPCCRTYSNGGAGGPGVIQLHVGDPVSSPGTNPNKTDIVVPTSVAISRFPLDALASPSAIALFPTCNPFPRSPLGWFGGAKRRLFARMGLSTVAPMSEMDLGALQVPPVIGQ